MNSISRIEKETGTHADVLAAVGAASLVSTLRPRLLDEGNAFRVVMERDPQMDDVDGGPGFQYLKTKSGEGAGVPEAFTFDYAAQSEKYKRQQAARKERDRQIAQAVEEDQPDPEFRSYRVMNVLQGDSGPNKVVEEFLKLGPDEWRRVVWDAVGRSGSFPVTAPLVQLFNPQSAKGYALLKPTDTDRNDKTKDKWAEPFLEWLRYRGFFSSCAGWFIGSKGEHVRIYCPIPRNISFELYKDVAAEFRARPLAGSVAKIDCRGALALTAILARRTSRPSRSISGIWVTHYQSLGQAKAVTSIEQLAVPDWFKGADEACKVLWIETLEEHDKVLCRLSDEISEELILLKQYRRFLQCNEDEALPAFIEFLSAYGHQVFRRRGQGKWLLPQFSAANVEAILGQYSDVIGNPGFQAVAAAIRAATVNAQVAKKRGGDYREIQYGLLPELRRKLELGPDELMRAIADFISAFNSESARRNENSKSGYRVAQDEFAEFAALMDSAHNPRLVGALLCAYATCKRGKEEEVEEEVAG